MLTLFNPTNEEFKMVFAGMDVIMKPGAKLQSDDAKANHLLNAFGQRGLCQLVFGDKEEVVGKAGVERNTEFKKAQVVRYNLMNEQRKNQGQSYLTPSKQIQGYAQELGISLLEPYALKDLQASAMTDLTQKNKDLEHKFSELSAQNAELLALLQKLVPPEELITGQHKLKGKG
jgi:hypothetical protein